MGEWLKVGLTVLAYALLVLGLTLFAIGGITGVPVTDWLPNWF